MRREDVLYSRHLKRAVCLKCWEELGGLKATIAECHDMLRKQDEGREE